MRVVSFSPERAAFEGDPSVKASFVTSIGRLGGTFPQFREHMRSGESFWRLALERLSSTDDPTISQ
jgi:hypothetical protein